jgi:hypothetical protein
MKTRDIKPGRPYFYQKGTADWRQRVNGDGMVYVLSTDTFVHPTSRDRATGTPPLVRESQYRGRPRSGKGMLAVIVSTNVHHGDIPQEAQVDFEIPLHVRRALAEHSCYAVIDLVRQQALLGDWDEIYTARKEEARAEFQRQTDQAEARRSNAERWQDASARAAEVLGESPYFQTIFSTSYGETEGQRRSVAIEVMEKLVEMAEHGQSYRILLGADADTPGMDPL